MERGERDPYDVLGVDSNASEEEVRAAFRRKAEIYHPDRYQDRPVDVQAEAARMMAELTEARDRIKQRRATSGGRAPSNPPAPASTPRPARSKNGGQSAPRPKPPPRRTRRPKGAKSNVAGWLAFATVLVLVVVASVNDLSDGDERSDTTAESTASSTAAPAPSPATTDRPDLSIPRKTTSTTSTPPPGLTIERLLEIPVPECPVPIGEFGFVAIAGSPDDPSGDPQLEAAVGDVTGDGGADGAYTSLCNGGGSGVFYDTWVFDSSGALLGRLPVAEDASQTLSTYQVGLELGAGTISVVAAGPTDCTACNPNVYVTLTYQWNGSGFDLISALEDGGY